MEMLGFVPGIFFMVNSGEFLVKVVEGMLVWALAVADPCLQMHPQLVTGIYLVWYPPTPRHRRSAGGCR